MDLFLQRASDGRGDEVWVGLGVMSVGGRVPMVCSKVVSGSAGVQPNTFGGHNNCLQQSGCGSELPPRKPWFDNTEESSRGIKETPIRQCVTVSQGGNWSTLTL